MLRILNEKYCKSCYSCWVSDRKMGISAPFMLLLLQKTWIWFCKPFIPHHNSSDPVDSNAKEYNQRDGTLTWTLIKNNHYTDSLLYIFFLIICLPLELLSMLGPLERWCDAYTWHGPAVKL